MRVVDHAAIYLLIAGTYTPFALISLAGPWGWSVIGVVWGLALAGMVFEAVFIERFRAASVAIYLGLGWFSLLIIKPLLVCLPIGGLAWLLAGGLAYSVGVIFYLWKRLPQHHAIWHLFVMAGSTCHFFAIMLFVLPPAA